MWCCTTLRKGAGVIAREHDPGNVRWVDFFVFGSSSEPPSLPIIRRGFVEEGVVSDKRTDRVTLPFLARFLDWL